MRLGLVMYVAMVLCFTIGAGICYAAGDPISTVNNLSNFIFSLIRAIGLILLGLGIMQVGLSLKSRPKSESKRVSDPSRWNHHHVHQRDTEYDCWVEEKGHYNGVMAFLYMCRRRLMVKVLFMDDMCYHNNEKRLSIIPVS